MSHIIRSLSSLLLLGTLLGSVVAQDPDAEAKARIEKAVQATSLKFERSPSGKSLVLRFDHEGGRKQSVYVAIDPGHPTDMTMHTIYTHVWTGDRPPDAATMQKVFGSVKKLGSFYLFTDSQGKWAIRFGVQFDVADLPAGLESGSAGVKALEDTIRFVERVGEETDAMLNGDVDNR